jgi:predicted nucleotidyltransferase
VLQGSQNYGLDYEGSDIDTKPIVTPSFKEIAMNHKPVSTTHIRANDEHIDFKDIRLYIQTFRKQNLNFLEILFSQYAIINPIYAEQWNRLVDAREEVARYSPVQAIKSMRGIAKEKYFAMEHHYPSRMEWINKFGYDPKQFHHLWRVEEYIERYIKGESYADCLMSKQPEVLQSAKLGNWTLGDARWMAKNSIDRIDKMCDEYLKNCSTEVDKDVDALLDDVQYNIMKIAIKKEIGD